MRNWECGMDGNGKLGDSWIGKLGDWWTEKLGMNRMGNW